MKISMSIVKSVWLFFVILLIMIANGLPVPLLIGFAILALAAPLIRESIKRTDLDERQIQIAHFSSNIGFYVFIALLLLVMIREFFAKGENPSNLFYMLLLVPLVIKFFVSVFKNYDRFKASQTIGLVFAGGWLLFAILSHGATPVVLLIEALPFLILVAAAMLISRWPKVSGIVYLLFGVAAGYFIFSSNFDLYMKLLMSCLVPLPFFIGGIGLVMPVKETEELT